MAHVEATAHISVDADTLWRRFGSFQGVGDWHPMLAKVEGNGEQRGAVRKAQSRDGQEQLEILQRCGSPEKSLPARSVRIGQPVEPVMFRRTPDPG